jgi:hypothetical protein
MERALIVEYEKLVDEILAKLTRRTTRPRSSLRRSRAHPRLRPREGRAPQDGEDARAALLAAFRAPTAAPKPSVVKVVV